MFLVLSFERSHDSNLRAQASSGKSGADAADADARMSGRCATLTLDPDAFIAGPGGRRLESQAKSLTSGSNWYPTANVKLYGTFERTMFDGDFSRGGPAECHHLQDSTAF
jgi:hypothetical protein